MSEMYPRHRLNVLSIAVTVIVCILAYRLVELQIIDHENYVAKAKRQWYRRYWHQHLCRKPPLAT